MAKTATNTLEVQLAKKKSLDKSNPQLPQTQRSLKEDVQWAKAQKSLLCGTALIGFH